MRPDPAYPLDSPPPPPQRLSELPSEPPVAAEDAVVYRGRVEGTSGVRVRLIGFPPRVEDPGRAFVWGAAVTGPSGRFRLAVPAERPGNGEELLVVESADTSRTIQLSDPRDLSSIRLPPVVGVRVDVRCRELDPNEPVPPPTLVAIWPRRPGGSRDRVSDEEVWTYRVLPPEGASWPAPLFPGRDESVPRATPPRTDRFSAEITLPRGQQIRLLVESPCGRAVREVDPPALGSMPPVVFDLPDPDDAVLEVQLDGAASRPPPYLLDVWSEREVQRISLAPSRPTVVRLPPRAMFTSDNIALSGEPHGIVNEPSRFVPVS